MIEALDSVNFGKVNNEIESICGEIRDMLSGFQVSEPEQPQTDNAGLVSARESILKGGG